MNHLGKVVFFCGKMGAGKTTASKVISANLNAILISEDEWLAAHYPDQIQTFEDYIKYSTLIKPFIKNFVKNILKSGIDVVMDFPANTRRQRKWFLDLCKELGCEHELIYLNIDNEQCLAQIKKRGLQQPERAQFDTEDMFNHVTKYFEPPSSDEGLNIQQPKL